MTIAFIHRGKAFLPDIDAYCRFFESKGIDCMVIQPHERSKFERDVDWVFMGLEPYREARTVTIHEYCSGSVPPFRGLKDDIKKRFNSRPDLRLFLNSWVRHQFDFNDGVPYGYRDIGLEANWTAAATDTPKKYDFIYVGAIHDSGHFTALVSHIATRMRDKIFLIVGNTSDAVRKKFAGYPNIRFEGPYPHEQIRACIQASRYALNWMPDLAPFNQQSSLKFLEYAACGVPVLTSDYPWIRQFEKQYGGKYFYLSRSLNNLEWDQLTDFAFDSPDLRDWMFTKQVERSGVLVFLHNRFPELSA